MATYSKLGYGNYSDIDSAISDGILDGKDIVITKDTNELIYIRDDKTQQSIRSKVLTFDSLTEANEALNLDKGTYAGQPVMIKDGFGKYHAYTVQISAAGEFTAEPSITVTQTHLVWQEF